MNLCGHATLASAHILWSLGFAKKDEKILFHSRSGELIARPGPTKDDEKTKDFDNSITLDFPRMKIEKISKEKIPKELFPSLGVSETDLVFRTGLGSVFNFFLRCILHLGKL